MCVRRMNRLCRSLRVGRFIRARIVGTQVGVLRWCTVVFSRTNVVRVAHPTCLKATHLVPFMTTYNWRCMVCKVCDKCQEKEPEVCTLFAWKFHVVG